MAAITDPVDATGVVGRAVFVTLLDGQPAAMEAGKWYEFSAEWTIGE